ncbi:MAG: methyltransferase NNMT/PNMT/TEMT [Candidatus Magnetoglobus multicellularis str. Araruama]|uniref:Methyltransferase NNMT/PNMT/TEMT n=1 Tax=Candidatus Magnetoglobus multicellularis str. Araruama TaxID=890399 RepID=A0A1V1NY81_9BACT|nr:MAG: methyltransferase NNMT/PNMT/TEMT [Candidatus Magnetoglobus multicellularis str. Araruama]
MNKYKKVRTKKNEYSSWNQFDPGAYVYQNYQRMMPEDHEIISIISNELRNMDIPLKHFQIVGDIGAGPNLYPGMLIAPYVSETGLIELIEPALPNRTYLKKLFNNLSLYEHPSMEQSWFNYESEIIEICGNIYTNALKRLHQLAKIKNGSIYDLPENKYEFVSCYFVAESITPDYDQFQLALNKVVHSADKGGIIVTTHMLHSEGYQAGKNTKFPAVKISLDQLKASLIKTGLNHSNYKIWNVSSKRPEEKVREGYQGMAVVVASKGAFRKIGH